MTWFAEAVIRDCFAMFVVLITLLSILLTNVFAPGDWQVALQCGGGLYWVLAGVVFGFVGASINDWVLLVEIQR